MLNCWINICIYFSLGYANFHHLFINFYFIQAMTKKQEKSIWKVKDQKCVVLIEVEGKIHQVDLDKEQMNSLIFVLPQLFDDHKIKVLEKELENVYFEKL